MLGVSFQKMWHKKGMMLCLLLGSILLVATVVSFPLYRAAAYDRMLQDEFVQNYQENGKWPGRLLFEAVSTYDEESAVIGDMETMTEELYGSLGIAKQEIAALYFLSLESMHSLMNRDDSQALSTNIGFLSDLPEHASVIAGKMYSESGLNEEGAVEVVVNTECMVRKGFLVGETLEFQKLQDAQGAPLRFQIVGVYGKADDGDPYWESYSRDLDSMCMMNEELFRQLFAGDNSINHKITCEYDVIFDYTQLKVADVQPLMNGTKSLMEESEYKNRLEKVPYMDILNSFSAKKTRIDATLFILQIPVLVLLGAFLFMISGQMYETERNEISVLKSRGGSGGQILRLYLYQNLLLTILGGLLGLPLGGLFCRMLGSANNFLELSMSKSLEIKYDLNTLAYGLLAGLASILIITIPALRHSRLSIVKLKQQKAVRRHSFWEVCFLDVICLGVGLYGYYTFSRNEMAIAADVLKGKSLDPLLYISSSLFILGMGLLFLRLQPFLVQAVFKIGKKKWKPASYASFIENFKNGRKQQAIMIFMILTIALGMYHATAARTIYRNTEDNTTYLDGADIVLKEVWENNSTLANGAEDYEFQYYEPDYAKYEGLEAAKSYTKVVYDEEAYVPITSKDKLNITLMGIHTKEFGENTQLDDSLLEKPYYEYLNELAVKPDGVLVSRNFQTLQNYKIGDSIQYYNKREEHAYGTILGFVDYWPEYQPTTSVLNQDDTVTIQDNYLVVAHLADLQENMGINPYEIWITLKADAKSQDVVDWIEQQDLSLNRYVCREADVEKAMEDPLLQGTNGILTMSFIVSLVLCAVGYLIYWIMSIRSREMLFGVLRACGMHKGELFHMLLNEQFFSGVLSILAGIVIGKIASAMFVPMLQKAYAATNQVLPMKLITESGDMYRLYGVILFSMLLCLGVLILLVFKLNVAKALKLGEE